jgi:hypothetical protein
MKILTTLEQVAALPVGTVVIDNQADVAEAMFHPTHPQNPIVRWQVPGDTAHYADNWLSLPVTVLYTPEEPSSDEAAVTCSHCKTPIYLSLGRWYHESDDNLFCMTPLQATPEETA